MAGFNLKDEEEVKEYLKNLSTEYRFGCYHEKKPAVCHLLGDFFEAIKQDYEKSAKLYRVNCEDYKWGHSCQKIGNYFVGEKGGCPEDYVKATEYYDKSCEYKYPEGCFNAGLMRVWPKAEPHIKRDDAKALELFKKGCDLKSHQSCFYLSTMYMTGAPGIFEKDMKKAAEAATKACQMGNVFACSNLSHMYMKGDGVPQDIEKATALRKMVEDVRDQHTKQFRTINFGEGGL